MLCVCIKLYNLFYVHFSLLLMRRMNNVTIRPDLNGTLLFSVLRPGVPERRFGTRNCPVSQTAQKLLSQQGAKPITKVNFRKTCQEFYSYLKSPPAVLQQYCSLETNIKIIEHLCLMINKIQRN